MKVKLAVLTVSSYTSFGSFNAEHWYGKIHCIDESERKSLELKRKLTDQKEVDYLNQKDDTTEISALKIGDETNRFKTREDVEHEAVRQWEAAFPSYDALVVGLTAVADPQRPLAAKHPTTLKILQCFWDAAKKTGGYEKNPKAMDAIFHEYLTWSSGNSPKKKRSRAARREGPRAPVKGP